jgi:(p)ppGpp synthase/HD superfamily hydrolase
MTPHTAKLIQKAEAIARLAHKDQKRRDGKPYITHPEAVVALLPVAIQKIVGWLHDVVEDTDVTLEDLKKEFPQVVVDAVDAVSRRKGESYVQFINRAGKNTLARHVKLADLEHNLSDLKPGPQREKYLTAQEILKNWEHPTLLEEEI